MAKTASKRDTEEKGSLIVGENDPELTCGFLSTVACLHEMLQSLARSPCPSVDRTLKIFTSSRNYRDK